MRLTPFAILPAAALLCFAQAPDNNGHSSVLWVDQMPAKGSAKLTVTSPAFKNGADIPFENTQYRGNIFPGLLWTKGPAGTKSYAAIVQGELKGPGSNTSIHLVIFNVPANVTKLDTGMTAAPGGATYGPNVHGLGSEWAGPHTHDFLKHAYHFEVFALDTTLPSDPKISLTAVQDALKGHVLASGEVVGLATMDPDSPEAAELRKKQGQ
jgi:para-nitrobenzyl esterase